MRIQRSSGGSGPHLAGETSPQEAPLLICAVGSTAHGTGLLACGSMRSVPLPEAPALVALGRPLPPNRFLSPPDWTGLPATGCAFRFWEFHLEPSESPPSSRLA